MKHLTVLLLALVALISACSKQPECSVKDGGNSLAPSSGCLVVDQGEVLLVKIMGGSYGPPGGSVNKRESAQCAAERETWEETGVEARAGELVMTFQNGFQLYACESVSGRDITITRPLEIKDADWFSDEQLSQLRWRYPEQGSIIRQLLQGSES
jgi:ADP-ribose pyrophosphatase YjhB (NUDIX family)